MARTRTLRSGSRAARQVLANPLFRPLRCGAGCPYRGQRHVHRIRNNAIPGCSYCGGPGGFLAGPGHSFSCPRYKKAPRAPKSIWAPGAKKKHDAMVKWLRGNPPEVETLIYPRVEKIFAVKPDGQPYVHEMESGDTEPPFEGSARAYGLRGGDVLITTKVLDAEDR